MSAEKIFFAAAGILICQGWLTFCAAEPAIGAGTIIGPCPLGRQQDRIPSGELRTWYEGQKFRTFLLDSHEFLPQVPEEDMVVYYRPDKDHRDGADCVATIFRIPSPSITRKPPPSIIRKSQPSPPRPVSDHSCICVHIPQAAWCWEGDVLEYAPSCAVEEIR